MVRMTTVIVAFRANELWGAEAGDEGLGGMVVTD